MTKKLPLFSFLIMVALITGCSLSASGVTGQSAPDRPDVHIYSSETTAVPTLSPTPSPTPLPTAMPTPAAKEIVVSFTGDCTLGQNTGLTGSNTFSSVVGADYAYPFKNAVGILGQDDLTLVNFEGTLTNSDTPREKAFTFKGPPEYVEILKQGSIEAVNLANNHSFDFWDKGLQDTKETLDAAGILWSIDSSYAIYEVEGVKIGMAGFCFPWDLDPIYDAIDSLRDQGCDIVIISVHAGVEKMYEPETQQVNMAHAIIDHGADIYIGHHPHRLQPIEQYNGKYILYSLSNFTFGGQPNLTDKDTAIVQCTFTLENDQPVRYRLHVIPFSMTTTFPGNDYCPIPYEKGTDDYERVMDKMSWSDALEQE